VRSVLFLLTNQHVHVPATGHKLKVKKGTGMGLPHSTACAELAFMSNEITLMREICTYQLDFYGRFKDDICIIYNNSLTRFI
jgi:hypothetical protein